MSCTNPIMIKACDGSGYMMVPCGKCDGCKMDKARERMVRICNESRLYDDSVVVNLSYDDDHLPENGSLVKSDYQKFLKLVRKRVYPDKVRYFLCGEYGDRFGRCHWHIILFNVSMHDPRVFTDHIPDGKGHYVVKCSCWDKGRVVVDFVTIESASYVARYVNKKIGYKPKDWYLSRGLQPEFLAMSLKPGIGFGFMEKYKSDILNHDAVFVNGIKFCVPRYYSKKLGLKDTIGYEMKQNKKYDEKMQELDNMSPEDWLRSGVDMVNEREQRSRNNRKKLEMKGR